MKTDPSAQHCAAPWGSAHRSQRQRFPAGDGAGALRACALSVMPKNRRRSSTAADSSPRFSNTARIAAASASVTTNIAGAWGGAVWPTSREGRSVRCCQRRVAVHAAVPVVCGQPSPAPLTGRRRRVASSVSSVSRRPRYAGAPIEDLPPLGLLARCTSRCNRRLAAIVPKLASVQPCWRRRQVRPINRRLVGGAGGDQRPKDGQHEPPPTRGRSARFGSALVAQELRRDSEGHAERGGSSSYAYDVSTAARFAASAVARR
jgi:hypothetical protein